MPRSTRRNRRQTRRRNHRRHRGAGYMSTQQMYDIAYQQPTGDSSVSTQPTDSAIRPVLNSTFKVGGKRAGRRVSRKGRRVGGFSPSVMGSFLQNAHQAIVPLALYSAYHFMPKKSRNIQKKRK